MSMSHGAAVFICGTGVAREVVASAVSERLSVRAPVEVVQFESAVGLTALVVQPRAAAIGLLDGVAAALARALGQPTWSMSSMAGLDRWMAVTAYSSTGQERWRDESRESLTARQRATLGKRLGQQTAALEPFDWPYWRLMAELPLRPARDLIGLGGGPTLALAAPTWREVGRSAVEPAPRLRPHRLRLVEGAHREQPLLIERRRPLVPSRRANEDAVMNRALELGEPREVQLPSVLLTKAARLATRYGVEAAWVLQAAVGRATPWSFPVTALPACAIRNLRPAVLVVSRSLARALAQSSLPAFDGRPASFDELVRVALTIGLDDLADDLRDDEKTRKRLARAKPVQP
ncbi:MAG: hypothetical protein IAE78_08900 [Myxococcus sp.]|nr:hypothetical protein [Myxococcus sp.]